MDKYDIIRVFQKQKDRLNTTRITIDRQLKDMSFSNIFIKQLAMYCGAALLCVVFLCVIVSMIAGLNCTSDMKELLAATALSVSATKNDDMSIAQETAHIDKHILSSVQIANNNGFINDSIVVLYNTTQQTIDNYSSVAILTESDRLNEWYQQQTGVQDALPIFILPDSLREFASDNNKCQLSIKSLRFVNNALTPEIVEAKKDKRVVATWTETDGLDPNRIKYEEDVECFVVGSDADSKMLSAISNYTFVSTMDGHVVEYNTKELPHNAKVLSQIFTANGETYEIDLVYLYAGIQPVLWYIILSTILLLGIAVFVALIQTKKIRSF